jgi:hypothetical protein
MGIDIFDRSGWDTNSNGETIYLDYHGDPVSDWQLIDGNWYYFDGTSHAMATGWLELQGKRYYLEETGIRLTGWVKLADGSYYISPSNGTAQTGWLELDGKRYYLNADGSRQNGWLALDGNNFYFTADGRVDFRELVKDLASVFKMRIELRQIGVRDEAKMMGGIGGCGRSLCCNSWLADFEPVSIKMAKVQNLSLNPTKISGICGRLMCCLKYENDIYMEMRKGMPEVGERIKTPDGLGKVIDTNILEDIIRVRLYVDEKPENGRRGKDKDKDKDGHKEEQHQHPEEKLSSDVYVYHKKDIRRIEKRHNKERNLFEGVDAATMKEIQQLIKD